MHHIGFTGTRQGMTEAQIKTVTLIVQYKDFYAHHGDCVGADAQFDAIVRTTERLRGVVMHPCNLEEWRAYCKPREPYDVVRDPKHPLARNNDIVNESTEIIATPKETSEEIGKHGGIEKGPPRSGTWYTIRAAQEAMKRVSIVLPNGWWVEIPARLR